MGTIGCTWVTVRLEKICRGEIPDVYLYYNEMNLLKSWVKIAVPLHTYNTQNMQTGIHRHTHVLRASKAWRVSTRFQEEQNLHLLQVPYLRAGLQLDEQGTNVY